MHKSAIGHEHPIDVPNGFVSAIDQQMKTAVIKTDEDAQRLIDNCAAEERRLLMLNRYAPINATTSRRFLKCKAKDTAGKQCPFQIKLTRARGQDTWSVLASLY